MAGRESRERPASGAARDYRLKRFELKTENRSRNNGSGQRFIASNGDSHHPTAEFRLNFAKVKMKRNTMIALRGAIHVACFHHSCFIKGVWRCLT